MTTDVSELMLPNLELPRLVQDFDWSKTAIGSSQDWPEAMVATVSLILRSNVPMVTLWGCDGVMIYNDGYARIAGTRHPSLLGMPVREAWPEALDFNDNVMRTVLGGQTLSYRDQHLVLQRNGTSTDAWFDLDYSAIVDKTGTILGVLAVVTETTDRVEAERWRSSELDRLRAMFEQAPGFVALMRGQHHVFELVNESYRKLVGSRDVVGKTARECYPDLEGQGFLEMLDRVYSSGVPYRGTAIPITFRDNLGKAESKFIDLVYQAVRDPHGDVVGVFAQGSDVTDRILAERALQGAEQQSRQIIDGAVDYAILQLDPKGLIVRWNEGARRIFGWSKEETEGRSWEMLFTPADAAAGEPNAAMRASLERGTAHHNRWHVRNSGELFWATGSISRLKAADGGVSGYVKVLRDSTEEYLAAEALAQAEARLKRAQEAGGVGVFSLDLRTSVLSPSPEFCRIFGLQPVDEILVDDVQALMFKEDLDIASDPDARRAGTAPLDTEYRIRRADDGQVRVIAPPACGCSS